LHTVTTIAASESFERDSLYLNGKEVPINSRGQTCIDLVRNLAQDRRDEETGELLVSQADWPKYKLRICSINTFPTGAGLASSAAGLACFVATLVKLFNAQESYPGEFTAIARQGSGSASRSMYGGFVKWIKGERPDGSDSIAVQIADENVS
jgi:diphosphomevalonate decarboxylase